MNIIFLDIDGVLNSQVFFEKTLLTSKNPKTELKNQVRKGIIERLEFYRKQICPERMAWLNKLCEETDSVIVVSSTWRKNKTIEELQEILNYAGAKFKVVGLTPVCACRMRGCEIRSWLDQNGRDYLPYDYVIIDDDSDMLLWQQGHFFQTDGYSGLTPNTCYRIKKYFNKHLTL